MIDWDAYNWWQILLIFASVPVAVLLSIGIPIAISKFVRKKWGEKAADSPFVYLAICLLFFIPVWIWG